jgi:hypothetical protein
MSNQITRALFALTVLWGALVFWVAPHPPMLDLPQHAGQVALLRDIVLGQSPWADLFRLNFFTPYVLGYGLALPLSMVMSVAAALKVLLSLGFIAFIIMSVKVRQHFEADARLDWLFIPGFFGFAYAWGFFTFLVASALGLAFILASARAAERRSAARSGGLLVIGLALLASHGLVFMFAWGVGGLLVLASTRRLRDLVPGLWPYAVLLLAAVLYFWIGREVHTGLEGNMDNATQWHWGWEYRHRVLYYAAGAGGQEKSGLVFLPVFAAMAAAPWVMGLRPRWRFRWVAVPFVCTTAWLLLVPHVALTTAFLFERFALFLLPAYAWLFAAPIGRAEPGIAGQAVGRASSAVPAWRGLVGVAMVAATAWVVLGVHSVAAWRFGRESADFDRVLQTLEPRQRALSMLFDRSSEAAKHKLSYMHHPLWYQAEKQGLVDFNFAWFPPQIVRFRPDRLPGVPPLFDWFPERFNWAENRGNDYRYFLIRHSEPIPPTLFDGAPCAPQLVSQHGKWSAYERRACP